MIKIDTRLHRILREVIVLGLLVVGILAGRRSPRDGKRLIKRVVAIGGYLLSSRDRIQLARPVIPAICLERAIAGLARTNTPRLVNVGDKNLAVADFTGLRRVHDGFYNPLNVIV